MPWWTSLTREPHAVFGAAAHTPLRGGSRGEKERPTARPPGRDYQGRHPALRRPVRDGRGEILGRVSPDASRYSGGAQAPIRRHVPEAVPPVWRLAGSMDAVTGSLRPQECGAKQEGHGTRCPDRAPKNGWGSSGLEIGPSIAILGAGGNRIEKEVVL